MDEGNAGAGGKVEEDDGDESSSGDGSDGNEAASMPVSRKTVQVTVTDPSNNPTPVATATAPVIAAEASAGGEPATE